MVQLAGLKPAARKRRHWGSSVRLSNISIALQSDECRAQCSTYLALRLGEVVGERGEEIGCQAGENGIC